MARKEPIIKHTDDELRAMQARAESKSDWKAAAAMTERPVKVSLIGPDRIVQRFAWEKSKAVYSGLDEFIADVASVAKRDVKTGEVLDGEGGYTVFGRLTTARESVANRYLPLGLSRGARVIRPVSRDAFVTYDDVLLDDKPRSFRIRRSLEEEVRKALER